MALPISRNYIFLVFLLFSFSLVGAQEDPTFQVNTQFDLKRTCSNNGFFCASNVDCNITITKPDGSIMIHDVNMTFNTTFRNVTVPFTRNDQLGFARAIQGCANATNGGVDTFDIAITADGKPYRIFPQQFFVIILGFIFIVLGFAKERLRLFKSLGAVIFMIMGVITLWPGYSFINWTTLMGLSLGSILIGLGFYFLIEDSFARGKQDERFTQEGEDDERFYG